MFDFRNKTLLPVGFASHHNRPRSTLFSSLKVLGNSPRVQSFLYLVAVLGHPPSSLHENKDNVANCQIN